MAFKILPDKPPEPMLSPESVHRLPAQAAKGALAATIGFPGDIASTLNQFVAAPLTKALGQQPVPYEETAIGKILPTTQMHVRNLEEGIPYLKPKNKVEQFANNVVEDAASLFIPGQSLAKVGLRATGPVKALATSLGANAAGEAVKDFTGDETKGAYTKMGTMFLLSALNKPGAQKEIGKLYQKADELLPKDAVTSSRRLQKELGALKEKVLAGRHPEDLAASEKFVVDQANTILRQADMGEINVSTLKAAARSLNENLQKAVYEAPDKSTKVRARSLAKGINRSINATLSEYGKVNPEWWKTQKSANEAFGASQQSNFITNLIENNIVGNPVTHGLLQAFGIGATAATGIVPYQSAKVIYQIAKSPTLAKHYARIVSSAAAEDIPLMNKELRTLDRELQKEQSEKPSRFRILD